MPYIQPIVALFLISHVFSVITYTPLLKDLCDLIFNVNDTKTFDEMCMQVVDSKGIQIEVIL
jgi:hypothetical protein